MSFEASELITILEIREKILVVFGEAAKMDDSRRWYL